MAIPKSIEIQERSSRKARSKRATGRRDTGSGRRANRATCNPDLSVCNPTERQRTEI